MSDFYDEARPLLHWLLERCRAARDSGALRHDVRVRRALKDLKLPVRARFLEMLRHNRKRFWDPLDYGALLAIGAEPHLWAKLTPNTLSETAMWLLEKPRLRRRVSRAFLRELDNEIHAKDESEAWADVAALDAALEQDLIECSRIRSVAHYRSLVSAAVRVVNSEAYRLPSPPFPLPEGWRWMQSGADLATLHGYDASNPRHRVETYHAALQSCALFIAADPHGVRWHFGRADF